jgi:hypothetical protein
VAAGPRYPGSPRPAHRRLRHRLRLPGLPVDRAVRRQTQRGEGAAAVRAVRGHGEGAGLRFANPLYRKRTISQRVRNFESSIAARARIVEGAVGMVEMALDMLSKKNVVTLDEERKAAMVSNLLVVLCGERNTQPIVNAGTLHH